MMPALTAWILKDWMWPGKHTIFASCVSPGCDWHYLTYTLEVVKPVRTNQRNLRSTRK
jgi:hypothetical protein